MHVRYEILYVILIVIVCMVVADDAPRSQTPIEPPKPPEPSIGPRFNVDTPVAFEHLVINQKSHVPTPEGAPPLGIIFGGFDFDDNAVTTPDWYFIPPDPIGAAGPNDVVNVGNVSIQWFNKVGVQGNLQSLKSFFSPLGPPLGTFCFDPKVIYDQYHERFVVVTLERSDVAYGDPTNDSYILVAVSKTSDPNAGWWYLAIHSKLTIGITDSWADYPGLAVDDKAIYITNNMYSFYPQSYEGGRLWIIDKTPFYSGGAASWAVHDAFTLAGVGGLAATAMPAHMFGPVPAGLGTYLCSYSGLSMGGPGGVEWMDVIEVSDPLGTAGGPFFTAQFVTLGDIEDVGGVFGLPDLPDAPQRDSMTPIEVNDRRVLNAVWRDNTLYASTTILPNTGPDAGQTTAHWFQINTAGGIGALMLSDQGDVGADDLGAGTYTFFPSVMVDHCGNMAVGFSASSSNRYCGAFYTGRLAGDPAGTVQSTGVLLPGVDWYVRTFGGARNRWGDYSGIALDPVDESTFWLYNAWATLRGTPLGDPPEDGRWSTVWGKFTLGCPPVSVTITNFEARVINGGVELTGEFATDSDNFRVDVYRGDDATFAEPIRYKSVEMRAGDEFHFVDNYVKPGKTYRYRLGVTDKDGEVFSQISEVTIPVTRTALLQNVPNPFNPMTVIRFVLSSPQHVSVSVYDANGKLVRTLVDGVKGYGNHQVEWSGTDNLGNEVGSGIYFYRLKAGKFRASRKMVLLK